MADNSNAAILVSLTPADFGSSHPLAGFRLQREIERAAFSLAGDYKAPAIAMQDFMQGAKATSPLAVTPSYGKGVVPSELEVCLPEYITDSMRAGLLDFDEWMPGFLTPESILTAPETRTTSPVKILRDQTCRCLTQKRIYPIGEGAGYAGGIVSSAVDGVRCAESILLEKDR